MAHPAAAISRVARIGSFSVLHNAVRFASRGSATHPSPKVDAGATDTDLLGNFSDRQTTLDPCVAKKA